MKHDNKSAREIFAQYLKDNGNALDMSERYNDMLREIYQDDLDKIPWLRGADAAQLFEEQDPIAYRCGYSDWLDSESRDGQIVSADGDGDEPLYDSDEAETLRSELVASLRDEAETERSFHEEEEGDCTEAERLEALVDEIESLDL